MILKIDLRFCLDFFESIGAIAVFIYLAEKSSEVFIHFPVNHDLQHIHNLLKTAPNVLKLFKTIIKLHIPNWDDMVNSKNQKSIFDIPLRKLKHYSISNIYGPIQPLMLMKNSFKKEPDLDFLDPNQWNLQKATSMERLKLKILNDSLENSCILGEFASWVKGYVFSFDMIDIFSLKRKSSTEYVKYHFIESYAANRELQEESEYTSSFNHLCNFTRYLLTCTFNPHRMKHFSVGYFCVKDEFYCLERINLLPVQSFLKMDLDLFSKLKKQTSSALSLKLLSLDRVRQTYDEDDLLSYFKHLNINF